MKKSLLLLTLLIILSTSFTLLAQWTSLGSGISASPRVLAGVYPVNENLIWGFTWDYNFVPAQEFMRTTDGGATWQSGNLTGVDADQFSIFLYPLDDQTAWLATADELDPIAGKIYKTSDGGTTWVHQSTAFTGFNETPAGVHFWNENEGFAYGATCGSTYNDQIAIYTTADGGGQWTKVVTPNMPEQLPGEGICIWNFASFFSVVGDTAWFGTNKGRIFKSTDKGLSWVVIASPFSTSKWVSSVNFKDANTGIAIGNSPLEIKRTIDGGMTWTTLTPTLLPGTIPAQAEYIPGTISTWMIVSHNDKYMVSYNDGDTWETHDSNIEAWSVEFLDAKTAFAGSYITNATTGGLYKWSGAPLGNRLYVNDDATGANNGSSWSDAFNDLQSALAIAEEGDQIWVAEGTYLPGSDPTATYLIDKNLRLYGGFAGTESSLSERGDPADYPTILSGDVNGDDVGGDFTLNRGDNVLHVITMTAAVGNETQLDGFAIIGGHADADTPPNSHGGGITSNGNPTIRKCVFTHNFSIDLGGAAIFLNTPASGEVRFEHCEFSGNEGNAGAAISLRFSKGSFENCLFSENTASDGGATPFEQNGGCIASRNSQLKLNRCTFNSNLANLSGGAFMFYVDPQGDGFSLDVDSCSFFLNEALAGGGAIVAPIWGKNVSIQITNSSFSENNGGTFYGAISAYTAIANSSMTALIENCQFNNNTAFGSAILDVGAIGNESTADFTILNCIFEGNTSESNGGVMGIFGDVGTTANFFVEDCKFIENNASSRGGVLWISTTNDQFAATVSHCEFLGNTSNSGAAVAAFQDPFFAPVIPATASVIFDNCLFAGNTSNDATISLDSLPGVQFLNCTITDNESGGIQIADQSSITLQNTILNNPNFTEYTASANSSASSNGGNLVLDNSLNAVLTPLDKPETAPDFIPGSYEPSATSPLVNAGVNSGVTATTDLAGNERIQQGTVDIGAYESPFFSTAIQEVFAGELVLSPNPASDFLNIQFPEIVSGQLEAALFDAQGKLVSSFAYAEGQSVDLQGLVPGVYMVKVVARETVYVGKFVKQ
jgi:photosystem II stability/assembly factor-like uncharacterized protein